MPKLSYADPDCVGNPVADAFHAKVVDIVAPHYFAPVPGRVCSDVAQAAPESFLSKLHDAVSPELAVLEGCPMATTAGWLSARLYRVAQLGKANDGMDYPDTSGERWALFSLADTADELLLILRSRFPIFSLLAWAHAFLQCNAPWHKDLVCADEDMDVLSFHPEARKVTGHVDATFWDVVLRTAKAVAGMGPHIIWINAARVVFDPRVNLDNLAKLAQEMCPVGFASAVVMRGLFLPWGGSHWAGAIVAADSLVKGLALHHLRLFEILRSPWPLALLLAQLKLRIDHDASAVSTAWHIKPVLRRKKQISGRVLGSCADYQDRKGTLVVTVSLVQQPFLRAWLGMLRSAGFHGSVVSMVPRSVLSACLDLERTGPPGIMVHCFGTTSISQEHETIIVLHSLLEMYSDFLLVDFDAILLRDPVEAVANELCLCSSPRPSHMFDRPAGLLEGAPYKSAVRYLRGDSGLALLSTILQNSVTNPFLQPLASVAYMATSHLDVALPQSKFASLDGVEKLSTVVALSNPSPWLASLYRPLVFGTGKVRRRQRRKLCQARLLPSCGKDYIFKDGEDCPSGTAITSLDECKLAAIQLRIAYASQKSGTWAWTPPGCFVHRGCSDRCRLHFGRDAASRNDGRFRALCAVAPGHSLHDNRSWAPNFARWFAVQDGSTMSLRPRLFQIGPSAAGTTSIRDFCNKHGMRTVKSYHHDRAVRGWINQAIEEDKPPLFYIDGFDAYTDFLDPFLSLVPWCSSGCEDYFSNITDVIAGYLSIVSQLAVHYPYSKFLYNMRNVDAWLASKSYNCWPWINQKKDRAAWQAQWERCCDARSDRAIRSHCMQSANVPDMPGDAGNRVPRRLWEARVCCNSAPTFRWIWKTMQTGVERQFASTPERLLVLSIENETASRRLSDFLGVKHKESAWGRSNPTIRV